MPAKLERTSLRTTPVSGRTLGPFEPSPGYGPSVSCGMRAQVDVDVTGVVLVVVGVVDAVVVVVVALGAVGVSLHPTNCKAPIAAPNLAPRRRTPRRLMAAPVASKSLCNPP